MHKLLILSLGAIQALLSLTFPAIAQEAVTELDQSCQAAVQSARSKLENNRDLSTRVSVYNNLGSGEEYPKDYPLSVGFVLDGTASGAILNSPQFLKVISTEVILGCEPVSTVSFSIYRTDVGTTYGLVGRNKVEEFKCIQAQRGNDSVPYGYQICP